jgi:hypothetical protein
MVRVVPLNWLGSFCNFGGPLAPGKPTTGGRPVAIGAGRTFVRPGHFILDLDTEVMTGPTDLGGLRRLATQYSIAGHPDHPRLVERGTDG